MLIPHPRGRDLVASATLAINERSASLAAGGREIYRFGLGQSPFPVPNSVVEALRTNAHQKDYLPVRGLLRLRESVAGWFNRRHSLTFETDNILIAPGSKELLFLIQMALDATLILPSPSWVSYHPQSNLAGNSTLWIDTTEGDDWCLTAESLTSCGHSLDGKMGLLLLNYPNNPTGVTYSERQLRELADTARKLNLVVISDEIYGDVDHRGTHLSIARFYPERTVVTTGLSKWCGAGGWRLGVAAFPRELAVVANMVANMASETYTSTSAPIQYAAITAFEENSEIDEYLDASRKVLAAVQDYVHAKLLSYGITAPKGTGGFYLFCNFEALREKLVQRQICNSDALAERLLIDTGIAVLPGSAFGRPSEELTIRLSYVDFDGEEALQRANELTDPTVFANVCSKIVRAMSRLEAWLA